MQRRIRFAGGSDGPEILPRSSHSGSRSSRNDKSGMIKAALMVAALIATVYVLARSTRSLKHSDLASTGEGEGLEDFMLKHDQQEQHHNRHEFRTARERDHDHPHLQQQHDTHAHQLHDSTIDGDGSIVVHTTDHPAATQHGLAPAHTVGGDAAAQQHAAAGHTTAHAGSHEDPAAAAQQQQHQAHVDVPATQQPVPAAQQQVPAEQQAQQPAHAEQHSAPATTQQQPAQATQQLTPVAQQPVAVPATQQPTHPAVSPQPTHAHPESAEHAAPAVQPPMHADAVAAADEFLPDPAEEAAGAAGAGAAVAPALQHQHHAHAARINMLSPATGLYALTAPDIDGRERHLSEFAGKVTLVVNVASQCGYTDANYKGLQEAYTKYHKFGFEILAFPSNEFGNQEPGTSAEIKSFCADRYNTTFSMFSKINVNGPSTHPVFRYLKQELPVDQGGGGGVAAGKDIGWNFYKFLVGRDGKPVKLFHQEWKQTVIEHAVYELLVDPQYVLDSGMHHG